MGFGILVAMMLCLSAFSLLQMQSVSKRVVDQNKLLNDKMQPLYVAREALAQTGIAARNAFIFTKDDEAKKELDILDRQKAIYLDALKVLSVSLSGRPEFEKVKAGLLTMADELKRPRAYREASKMEEFGAFLVTECSPLRRQIVADMDLLIKSIQTEVEIANVASVGALESATTWTLGVSAFALLISFGLAYFISRSITVPLGEAVVFSKKVAMGDLTVKAVSTSRDEAGELMRSLGAMNDSLIGIVSQVRSGTQTIANGSTEIASGNRDLSARTEHQASSLEETASATKQLSATVKQNVEHAHHANQLAISASGVATKGGDVVPGSANDGFDFRVVKENCRYHRRH